ncbi:hypothetical protein JCM14076_28790 [Methylosoma difficile]
MILFLLFQKTVGISVKTVFNNGGDKNCECKQLEKRLLEYLDIQNLSVRELQLYQENLFISIFKITRMVITALFFSLIVAGCSWTDNSGTYHQLIIGLGIVSVNQANPTAATVTSTKSLGLSADKNGLVAGYLSSFITSVPSNAEDVRIEASQKPFAPIKIEIQKALLNQSHNKEKITK